MNFIPTLKDFSTETDFLRLQNKFLGQDEKHITINEDITSEIIKDEFKITYKSIDEKENYIDINFYRDFIYRNLKIVGEVEIDRIQQDLDDRFAYNDHERTNFIKTNITKYEMSNINMSECNYLPISLKIGISHEIKKVLEFLYDDRILKQSLDLSNKMKIKMNKNDIHLLFLLLRQAKLIEHPYDSDLGRLIDNFFLYFDSKENEYKEIKKSNKDISNYKNLNKTYESSIIRLKEILSNENFYIIKP